MRWYLIVRLVIFSLLDIFSLLIVVRALLSFFVMMAGSEVVYKIYNVLGAITNPILEPIRRLLHKIPALERMPVDFSPMVALLLISVIRMVL